MRRFISAGVLFLSAACSAVSSILTAVMILTLGSCISIPVRVVHVQSGEQRVRASLGAFKTQILAAAAALPRVRCAAGECGTAADVAVLLSRIRSATREIFPPEAVGLREVVENEISAAAAQLGDPKPLDAITPVRWQAAPVATGYPAASVRAAIERIARVIDRLLAYDRLALTVNVQSSPSAADVVLQIGNNAQSRRTMQTNDHLANVWRGVYTTTVSKTRFKDGVLLLDLLNDGRTRITCTLRRDDDTADSSCRAQ